MRSSRSSNFTRTPTKSPRATQELNSQKQLRKRFHHSLEKRQPSVIRNIEIKTDGVAVQKSSLRKAVAKRKVNEMRPDYFAMKGQISHVALKEKLERDLINNMSLAEKMGVMRVLKDIHYDADSKMQWRERRRLTKLPVDLDPSELIDPEFPGYCEQMEKTQHEIAM